MSIAIDDTLRELQMSPESVLIGHEGFSLAAFPAKVPREHKQGVMRKPLENDPAHGEVFGKKTKSVQRALAKNSHWCVDPNLPPT
jgi:hypothetical protein